MITLSDVSKFYPDNPVPVIQNLSLTVRQGELLVILGSSGSGKSTLLKMINRLEDPTSGSITLHGKNIQDEPLIQHRKRFGYTFQQVGLFPHMNITDNISVGLRLKQVPAQERQEKATELLKFMQLDPELFSDRFPHQLSGGQQQRVGIARALVTNPDHLLMDEPFAAIDPINRSALQQEVLRLNHALNKTIVFVTHDISEAFHLAHRIAVLHNGQLQQLDSPEQILNRPATPFVESLLENYQQQLPSQGGH